MPEQVTPNQDQRDILERGSAFSLMVGVPGVKEELFKFLDEHVRNNFLKLLDSDNLNEIMRLQGELRVLLRFMENVDAARGTAEQVAAALRSSIDAHRERQRISAEDEFSRHRRLAATAEV